MIKQPLPANDTELDLYFLLKQLEYAKELSERSIWQCGTYEIKQMYEDGYKRRRDEYLKAVNDYLKKQDSV